MVKQYEHLKIEDHGQLIICFLSNPPTHTFTSKGVLEVHDFLEQMEKKDDLRVLAFNARCSSSCSRVASRRLNPRTQRRRQTPNNACLTTTICIASTN